MIVPQFRVSMSGGSESNDYASPNMETRGTYGYGFDWTPTERTKVSLFQEHRFFGDGHRYSISQRFPLSNIRYSDTKDVSILPNQFASVGLGTIFDMFYQICNQQLSGLYTDAGQLNQAASSCATNLSAQAGVSPSTQVVSSFLTTSATIQRNQQLAMAFQGARNTLTLQFDRTENQSILAANAVNNVFAQNNLTDIRQQGFNVNLVHTLTAQTNLGLMTSRQKSTGTGIGALEATMTMYQVNMISKLGPKTTGGVTIRHTEFDSSFNPYSENAIVATVSIIF